MINKGIRLMLVVVMIAAVFALNSCKQKNAGGQASAQPGKKAYTIAYIGFSSSTPFFIILKNGAAKAANELGVNLLDLTAASRDMAQQKTSIDNAILKKVDGLIIAAVDTRGLLDSFNKAQAAGIPIVTVDSEVKHPFVKCHIATDNIGAAKLAGEYIVKQLEGSTKKKVLIIGGAPGMQTADDRQKGVEEVCHQHGLETVFRPADWDDSKASDIAENELNANPDYGAIFAACDPMIITAKQAAKNKGLLGKIVLVGFDAIPACLKAIKKGEVDATVRQDPARMGREGVQMMVKLLNGEQIPRYIPIEGVLIDANNVDKYLDEK